METSVKIFRQIVLVFSLVPKTGTALSCTICKIPVNFPLSLDIKPGASNPNKWYRKFRSFNGKNGKNVIAITGGGGGETRSGTEK